MDNLQSAGFLRLGLNVGLEALGAADHFGNGPFALLVLATGLLLLASLGLQLALSFLN